MSQSHDDVLRAAMQLPEQDRMLLAEELIESVAEVDAAENWDDPEFLSCLGSELIPQSSASHRFESQFERAFDR